MSILDITNVCNLSCVYCCRNQNNNSHFQYIEDEVFLDIARQFIKNRATFLVLQGGEPLLHKNIVGLLRGLSQIKEKKPGQFKADMKKLLSEKKCGKAFHNAYLRLLIRQNLPLYCLTSNGMTYSEEIENALYDANFSVEISLDSHLKEVNEATRRGIDFKRVEDNIVKYANRLPVEISCTVTENNVKDLVQMVEFAYQHNCICLKLSPVITIGRQKESNLAWDNLYVNTIPKVLDEFKKYSDKMYLKIKLNSHIYENKETMEVLNQLEDTPNVLIEYHKCQAFKQVKDLYVDTNYDVYGCASMKNEKELVIGNLKEQSLKEIWESARRKDLYESIKKHYNCDEECGSCTLVAYKKQRDINIKN